MRAPRRRRSRLRRRLLYSLAVLAALLLVAVMLAWHFLPWLVTQGYLAATERLGRDEATITVARADLSGLHARAVRFRLGGLDLDLAEARTSYSLGTLLDGRLESLTIDGLTATLDFTRPRRGMLPDALGDLMAQFSGEGELVWPVDTLELKNCRLVLALPGGEQTILLSGNAQRRDDGMIDLALRASDPEQLLHIHGTLRTETLDGELTIERLSLLPSVWLDLAARIGAFSLPPGMAIDADRIDLSSTVTMEGGVPKAFSTRLESPALRLSTESAILAVAELTMTATQTAGASRTAELTARLTVEEPAGGWRLENAPVHVSVADGQVLARLGTTPFAIDGTALGRVGVEIESGLPPLGGPPRAAATISLSELAVAERAFTPISARIEGWTDRLQLTVPRLALADEAPVEMNALSVTMADPLGANRKVDAACELVATRAVSSLLPAGWTLAEPALPSTLARLEAHAAGEGDALQATLTLRSTWNEARLTGKDVSATCIPQLEVNVRADGAGASVDARLAAEDIAGNWPAGLPVPERASLRLELPRAPFEAFSALAAGGAPVGTLGARLSAALARDGQSATADLSIDRDPGAQGWRAQLRIALDQLSGTLAGIEVTGLSGIATLDSGVLLDSSLQKRIQEPATGPLLDAMLGQLQADIALNAAAIEQPGMARGEWITASFAKHAAGTSGGPFHASLQANMGILRAPPETIEQPALAITFLGDAKQGTLDTRLTAQLEGAPVILEARHTIEIDPASETPQAAGTFTLQPVVLLNSDIASRWVPELKGFVLSGTLAASGTTTLSAKGAWDGTARVSVSQGTCVYPAQDVRAEGLFAEFDLRSLATLRSAPDQRLGFSRLTVNDVVLSDGLLRLQTDSASVIRIEGAGFRVFDGTVTAEPFSLYFPDPDVALDLRMKDLDAGELVRTFDLFNGSLTGRLQGRLPIGLLAGKPIIGEGFLELQPEHPARLTFDAGGLFTQGLPNSTTLEKINRLPHELIEEGLANLQLQHFRVDLFRRDRPDRPIEILLGGVARTERADVPIELAVNLNGSMSEVLDLLLQLLML